MVQPYIRYWEKQDFQKISKANKNSNVGASVHTGGSNSTGTLACRMDKWENPFSRKQPCSDSAHGEGEDKDYANDDDE
ncbi:hypothetical protein CRG98_046555 [Punica granatum]|uniref:Uncharacterized protein n=1 Tax=Punica granatum TaxID=22663 RepID=A0A2I0HMV3_PUNGR|nr:hypothetical protein CRG98_046555 [Punica granatum]